MVQMYDTFIHQAQILVQTKPEFQFVNLDEFQISLKR